MGLRDEQNRFDGPANVTEVEMPTTTVRLITVVLIAMISMRYMSRLKYILVMYLKHKKSKETNETIWGAAMQN